MIEYLMLLDTEEERRQLTILYKCYRDALFFSAKMILKDEGRAEDAVHEAYLKLLNCLDKVRKEDYRTLDRYLRKKERDPGLNLSKFLEKENKKSCHRVWGFIVTIMKNFIYDELRLQKRRNEIPFEEHRNDREINLAGLDYLVAKTDEERYMIQCIYRLPYPYKEVLYLQYYCEYSSDEIGELLNKTPANIRQISKRGRDRLRQWMREGGYSL